MHTYIQCQNQQVNRRHIKITYLLTAPEPTRGGNGRKIIQNLIDTNKMNTKMHCNILCTHNRKRYVNTEICFIL